MYLARQFTRRGFAPSFQPSWPPLSPLAIVVVITLAMSA